MVQITLNVSRPIKEQILARHQLSRIFWSSTADRRLSMIQLAEAATALIATSDQLSATAR